MPQFDGLLVVAAISFGVPFLLGLHRRVLLPPVVLEIVAGIVIGPSVLAVTDIDPTIEVVSVLGLAFVLFLAGMAIDPRALRGPVLRLVVLGFMLSLALAAAAAAVLALGGLVQTPLLVAVTLAGTALGVLVPILKDSGQLRTTLGQLVIASGSIADITTIVLLSVLFSREGGIGSTLVLVGGLLALAVLILVVLTGASRLPLVRADLSRLQILGAFVPVSSSGHQLPAHASRSRSPAHRLRSPSRGSGPRGDPRRLRRRCRRQLRRWSRRPPVGCPEQGRVDGLRLVCPSVLRVDRHRVRSRRARS